jgi:hypothetical protein
MSFENESSQENLKPAVIKNTQAAEMVIGKPVEGEVTAENYLAHLEQTILDNVNGLPEELAEQLGLNTEPFNQRVAELQEAISSEDDPDKLAELQHELIYQHIALTSSVQNGGDKGFTPAVAREVQGMDCSLSAWSLKERLGDSAKLQGFEFGYPPGHAVGIVTDSRGDKLYVDAQNGFVSRVELEQVYDENVPNTTYPIYEIKSEEPIKGHLPDGSEVHMTREGGVAYVPKYLGIKEDGVHHTIGNMHMLYNATSPTYGTEEAYRFREYLGIPTVDDYMQHRVHKGVKRWEESGASDDEFNRYVNESVGDRIEDAKRHKAELEQTTEGFRQFVDEVGGGRVIHETKFAALQEDHHKQWRDQQQE